MKSLDYIPADYGRIKIVKGLTELFNEPFGDASVILFPRSLTEDFNALAKHLHDVPSHPDYFRTHIENLLKTANDHGEDRLGRAAKAVLTDLLPVAEYMVVSRLSGAVRVENTRQWIGAHSVENFHADFAENPDKGRILCCYTEPVTQWIKSEDARWVDRSEFKAVKGAPVYSFQPGDIFRIKALPHAWNVGQGKPDKSYFVHRVPQATKEQQQNIRLLWVMG